MLLNINIEIKLYIEFFVTFAAELIIIFVIDIIYF